MKSQVFGCPGCQQPFQVLAEQAGQIVQCPSCAQSVEIPATAFSPENVSSETQSTAAPEIISTCNHCQRQFGVTAEMFGTQVACPHCRQATEIQDPTDEVPVINIETEEKSGIAQSSPEAKSEQIDAIQQPVQPATTADTQDKPSIANLLPPPIGSGDSSKRPSNSFPKKVRWFGSGSGLTIG